MSETRRQYDPEFRAGAVRIVSETRGPVAEVARELGICEGALGSWVRKDRARASGAALDGDERAELARLRRGRVDAAVKKCFEASGGAYGSPRVRAQLRRGGLAVSKKTVEASMARQGLQGRPRRRGRP